MRKAFKTEGDFKKWSDNSKHPIKIIPSKGSSHEKALGNVLKGKNIEGKKK